MMKTFRTFGTWTHNLTSDPAARPFPAGRYRELGHLKWVWEMDMHSREQHSETPSANRAYSLYAAHLSVYFFIWPNG